MTHAARAITPGLLLALSGCADATSGSGAASAAGLAAVVAFSGELDGRSAIAVPPARHAAVGIYDIDLPATKRRAGFLGGLVEAKMHGASLELRADLTYAGRKNGKPESTGTWSIQDGELTILQAHKKHEPAAHRGTATIENGVLSLQTQQLGITIHLVFRRRS